MNLEGGLFFQEAKGIVSDSKGLDLYQNFTNMFDLKRTKTFVLEFIIKVSCLNNCVSIFEARSSVSKRCDTTASYHF